MLISNRKLWESLDSRLKLSRHLLQRGKVWGCILYSVLFNHSFKFGIACGSPLSANKKQYRTFLHIKEEFW